MSEKVSGHRIPTVGGTFCGYSSVYQHMFHFVYNYAPQAPALMYLIVLISGRNYHFGLELQNFWNSMVPIYMELTIMRTNRRAKMTSSEKSFTVDRD